MSLLCISLQLSTFPASAHLVSASDGTDVHSLFTDHLMHIVYRNGKSWKLAVPIWLVLYNFLKVRGCRFILKNLSFVHGTSVNF